MSRSFCSLRPGSERNVQLGADAGAELVRLEQVVGRDRHQTAVADLHLAMELQEPLVLSPVLRTETAAGEHQHQRIASLQLRERAVLAAVVGKLVVGKDGAGNDVGPHAASMPAQVAGAFDVERGILGRLLGSPPALARDDVGGVPLRPVVLRSGRFVLAMALLCLAQKLGQRRDVQLLSPRPGSRVLISWSSQPLPSGSLNEAQEK